MANIGIEMMRKCINGLREGERGFTLIRLLVAVAIGWLAAVMECLQSGRVHTFSYPL